MLTETPSLKLAAGSRQVGADTPLAPARRHATGVIKQRLPVGTVEAADMVAGAVMAQPEEEPPEAGQEGRI